MTALTDSETYPGLFDLLFSVLETNITPATEAEARQIIVVWLTRHGIEMKFVYENEHPVSFIYAEGKVVQIHLLLEHGDQPIGILAGSPPRSANIGHPVNDTADVSEHSRWPIQ